MQDKGVPRTRRKSRNFSKDSNAKPGDSIEKGGTDDSTEYVPYHLNFTKFQKEKNKHKNSRFNSYRLNLEKSMRYSKPKRKGISRQRMTEESNNNTEIKIRENDTITKSPRRKDGGAIDP